MEEFVAEPSFTAGGETPLANIPGDLRKNADLGCVFWCALKKDPSWFWKRKLQGELGGASDFGTGGPVSGRELSWGFIL